MSTSSIEHRLAVCSWSLQPTTPEELASRLQATGVNRVQLALDPLRECPAIWGKTKEILTRAGISVASGMFGCVGEDYTTLDSIRRTGGVAPDGTWEQNLKNFRGTVKVAKSLGVKYITFHAGFLPHDAQDPAYAKMLKRLTEIAGIFSKAGIQLGMETGQETASDLLSVLKALNAPNIGVNFDPANMLLYDKGHPIEAMRALGSYIRSVHIKDARRTKVPGTWGEEVVAGTGEVEWPSFFATLKSVGFTGDFVIEREAGTQRVADIQTARKMVERCAV